MPTVLPAPSKAPLRPDLERLGGAVQRPGLRGLLRDQPRRLDRQRDDPELHLPGTGAGHGQSAGHRRHPRLESANSATVSATTTLGPGQPGPLPSARPWVSPRCPGPGWCLRRGQLQPLRCQAAPPCSWRTRRRSPSSRSGWPTNTAYGLIVNAVDINGGRLSTLLADLDAGGAAHGFRSGGGDDEHFVVHGAPTATRPGLPSASITLRREGALSSITSTKTTASLGWRLLPNATFTVTVGALNADGLFTASGLTSTQTVSVSLRDDGGVRRRRGYRRPLRSRWSRHGHDPPRAFAVNVSDDEHSHEPPPPYPTPVR